MKTCTAFPYVRTPKGFGRSRLYNDLLHFGHSRDNANELYFVATDDKFKKAAGEHANYDENGEITYESLNELLDIDTDEQILINILEKDANVGTYNFDEAVTRAQQFNEKNAHRNKYMVTLKKENNLYHLSVVKRTPQEEERFKTVIRNKKIEESIVARLREVGVGVTFLTEGDAAGRYSTENAEKAADGLYYLISIVEGKEGITDVLAEEAGHFVVGSMGEHPLVTRLQNALTPEAIQSILGEESIEDKNLGVNPSREVAGMLVGKALINALSNKNAIEKLASKIAAVAKKIFARITLNQVQIDRIRAEEAADKIAKEFFSSNYSGKTEEAIRREETLYSAAQSSTGKMFASVINTMKDSMKELRTFVNTISPLYQEFEETLVQGASGRIDYAHKDSPVFDQYMIEGIVEILTELTTMMGPGSGYSAMMSNMDLTNNDKFFANLSVYATQLRQTAIFIKNGENILKAIDSYLKYSTNTLGEGAVRNLKLCREAFTKALNILASDLYHNQKNYICRFYALHYGEEFVETSRRIVFSYDTVEYDVNGVPKKKDAGKILKIAESGKVSWIDVVENLDSDISGYEHLFTSASNSPDLITQLADVVVRMGNKAANDRVNSQWDALRILEKQWGKLNLGRDQSYLFERFDDGSLTGNLKSELKWGEWEKNRDAELERLKAEFRQQFVDPATGIDKWDKYSNFTKDVMWREFRDSHMAVWHSTHSMYSDEFEMMIPADGKDGKVDYTNYEFKDELDNNPELKEWYNNYMQIKRFNDSLIPHYATTPVRAPQFRANLTNKIRNRRVGDNIIKAGKNSFTRSILETFGETSEDYDFGCIGMVNTLEDDLFQEESVKVTDEIRRIPLFGINKIKDTNDLSTDLMHSTLAYASMACSYASLKLTADALEVGRNQLKQRTVEGTKESDRAARTGKHSRTYQRFSTFMDMQVYGMGVKRVSKSKIGNIVPEKFVSFMTRVGAYMYLGWNVFGGTVNTLTGCIEIFKEACSGEFFTFKDLRKAHKMYFKNFVGNWMDFGKQSKDNKISLFCRHFDTTGDNIQKYRSWSTTKRGLFHIFEQLPFLAYKSGDHYMQTISYLATSNAITLYDASGNQVNLYDAYEVVDNISEKGKYLRELLAHIKAGTLDARDIAYLNSNGLDPSNPLHIKMIKSDIKDNIKGKTLVLRKTFFKEKDSIDTYNMINHIIEQLETMRGSSSPILAGGITLTAEESQYLANNGINIANVDAAIATLKDKAESLTWNKEDESKFEMKAREINTKLHGIYDKQNKVAFANSWWGNALLSMRGWAVGWVERRFAPDHYSIILGRNIEGSFVTMWKIINLIWGNQNNFRKNLLYLTIPFSSKTREVLINFGFSENQVGNLRRSAMDSLVLLMLLLLKFMTSQPPEEERGKYYEEDTLLGLIHYFTGRLALEQSAMETPAGIIREYRNLVNLTPTALSALFDIATLVNEGVGLTYADEDNSLVYYQKDKEGKYEKGDAKFIHHIMKYTPYRNVYIWEHPYAAYESFEGYGRKK